LQQAAGRNQIAAATREEAIAMLRGSKLPALRLLARQ
jgi:hypothetical protein